MTQAFEKPERSCFNLTHYAKLIPESHCIFVMPPGCARILRLSAIEEGISNRFTMFNLEPADIIDGGVEEILLDAAHATLERLTRMGQRPKIFCVFVSCVDSFIGTDHTYVLEQLRREAPDVIFLDLAVDPINRDTLPPLVRLHNQVTDLFEKTETRRTVNWLGSHLPANQEDPLPPRLEERRITSIHLSDCPDLDALRMMGNSAANVVAKAVALPAARRLKARLGIPYYNLVNPQDPESMTEEALLAL